MGRFIALEKFARVTIWYPNFSFSNVCYSFNLFALISANEIDLKPLIFVIIRANSRSKKICDEYAWRVIENALFGICVSAGCALYYICKSATGLSSYAIFFYNFLLVFLFMFNFSLACVEHNFPITIFSQPVKEKPKDIFLLSKISEKKGTTDKVPPQKQFL